MRRRYLCNLLRTMRYHACHRWGEPDSYMLQIVDDYRLVFSEIAPSSDDMITRVKKAGIQVHGRHYLDYLTPQNALEKAMTDDVVLLSKIVTALVSVEALEGLGYSKADAKRILKNAAYAASDVESESDT